MTKTDTPVVKPEVVFIEDLLNDIASGKLRIPKFQRPYVWKPSDMLSLFDSINRGFPIGSMLLWETSDTIVSTDTVGPVKTPKLQNTPITYVLDGHQRLATLFGCLKLEKNFPEDKQSNWCWWVWFDLEKAEFIHILKDKREPHMFPVRSILRTIDFLEEARQIEAKIPDFASNYISKAEELSQRIKNFKIPITRIQGGILDQAVNIFSRLNTKGQSMALDQMVSALTYREGSESMDLAEKIDEILEQFSEFHFGTINRITILHAIVAAAGKDIHKTEWESLAKKLDPTLLRSAAADASTALVSAVKFLREYVLTDKLLPYTKQLLLISHFYLHCPGPTEDQKKELIKWLWGTTLYGWFASASTTKINNALKIMRDFAQGKRSTLTDEIATYSLRPFPLQFYMGSARVRILIMFMLSLKPLDPETGEEVSTVRLLSDGGPQALIKFFSRGVDKISSPANRILLNRILNRSIKDRFTSIPSEKRSEILASHGISENAYSELIANNHDRFIQLREEHIAKLEHEYILKLGLSIPPISFGDADSDTDDD